MDTTKLIPCRYCGKLFTPTKDHKYYCSDRCKVLGAEKSRKEWEIRTDYKEKDRLRKRKAREENRKAVNTDRELRQQILKEERERESAAHLAEAEAAFREKCEAGDPLALMLYYLDNGGNTSEGYLENYARYTIATAEKIGQIAAASVNGISVYDPLFVEKVISSVNELGSLTFLNGNKIS